MGLVEALPRFKFWKSENSPISWTEWNTLINFFVNIDIHNFNPKRLRNDSFHRSRLYRAPNSEKVKMALSLGLDGILWWNFAYTLILTWCSPWDSQMTFGIGQGFAEVQILKTVKFNSYLDPILIYISLWIDCLFEIRKIAVCFLWLSLPGDYRVTDEALLAETT